MANLVPMNKSNLRKLSILLLTSAFLSCGNSNGELKQLISEYGYGQDSIRKEYGLPLMSSDFQVNQYGMDFVSFQPAGDKRYYGYVAKSVFWDKEGVYLERNFFYNSPTERLQIYCFYRRISGIDTVGVCHWYQNNNDSISQMVTKHVADSLLTKWKIRP